MGEIYTMILTQNVTFECHVNILVVCYLKNVIIDVIMYVLFTHFIIIQYLCSAISIAIFKSALQFIYNN